MAVTPFLRVLGSKLATVAIKQVQMVIIINVVRPEAQGPPMFFCSFFAYILYALLEGSWWTLYSDKSACMLTL